MDKMQLAERLIKEGKISLEEALVLMGKEEDDCKRMEFVPFPVPAWPQQVIPWYGTSAGDPLPQLPFGTCFDNNDSIDVMKYKITCSN